MSRRLELERAPATGELLRDRSWTGGERPWRARKLQSLRVAAGYEESGFDRIARAIRDCGTQLHFASCPHGHERRLVAANFCRRRLCTMCMWRRSLKVAFQVRTVAHESLAREAGLRFLFWTGTIRNVPGEQLGDAVTQLSRGFQSMVTSKRFGGRGYTGWLAGYFRALEVTYNAERDDYHPHIHALLAVRPSYWRQGYMGLREWREAWQEAVGVDYLPLVEVHPVRQRRRRDGSVRQGIDGAAAEVAKYAVDPEFLDGGEEWEEKKETVGRVVRTLHTGLAGRRLTSYGGLLARVYRDLLGAGVVDDAESDSADLIRVDDREIGCQCSVCQSDLVEQVYRWFDGLRDYANV